MSLALAGASDFSSSDESSPDEALLKNVA